MQLLSTSLFNQREGVTRVRDGMRPKAGSAKLGTVAAAFVLEQAAVHGAVTSRGAGKHVVQGIDQWTADMAQLREIHGSAAYPVQMHHIGFFHLGRVKSHAQHVQGERQVFFLLSGSRMSNPWARWRRKASVALLAGVLWISRPSIFLRLRSSRVDFRPGICRFRASLNR